LAWGPSASGGPGYLNGGRSELVAERRW